MASINTGENVEIEIKIMTMDHKTYTIRTEKSVPIPKLREQIAQVSGVDSDHQRLLFCGKFINDDQNLSAYNVEDGHTLHLVPRPPISPESLDDNSGHGPESTEPDAFTALARAMFWESIIIRAQMIELRMRLADLADTIALRGTGTEDESGNVEAVENSETGPMILG